MQITVVRIWLLPPYPKTHKEPCLGCCQSSRTPSNDDEVVVIGLREILGAIHFHWILKYAFLRSLKKKNNGRENNLTQKQQCLERSVKGPFFEEKQRHFQRRNAVFWHIAAHDGRSSPFPRVVTSHPRCGRAVSMPRHVATATAACLQRPGN